MGFLADLGTLYHLAVKPVRGTSHAARLESFYAGQATHYDRFRQRLLQGRRELWNAMPTPAGGVWVDMGGATGRNLEYLGDRIRHGWWTRTVWPVWFARDNVHLSPDHVPFLHARFDTVQFREHLACVPYLPVARVPYYTFVGRQPVIPQ